jgi:hypothetical protein
MMDILLTHDQQGDAIDEALKRCVADKELSPAHEIAAEACRAQLRQVVEWMERETAPHDPNHYWMGARRILREETLAALREAAGGEEK